MQLSKFSGHIILAFFLISGVQIFYSLHSGVFSGQLADPDCYTWLVRAAQLHETRQWFDATLYRVDPPYGLEQHWTRPLDVLLLVGAWVLTPFLGFDKAIYAWGVMFSPVFQFAAVIFLIWAFAPVFNNRQLMFLTLGFLLQPAVISFFLAGRPDHHSLTSLLFVVSLGFLIRTMQEPVLRIWPWAAGLFSALAFWINIANGVFIILPMLTFLSILWLIREKDIGTALFNYTISLLVFSSGALLIQNGLNEFFRPETDRISIIFILFFLLITIYAFCTYKYGFSNKIHYRFLFSGFAGLAVIGIMYSVFPQLFAGREIDPLYRAVRTVNIVHHTPIFTMEWPKGIIQFIFWTGFFIPTFIWFMHALFTKKWWRGLLSNHRKDIYVKLSIFSIIILVAYAQNALTVRYIFYVGIVCLLGYVVLMDNILRRIETRLAMSKALYLARPLAMFIMLTWFFYPMFFHDGGKGNGHDADILSTIKYIQDKDSLGEEPRNIMAAPEVGPYVLYYTNHNVFSITNHRVRQGFNDWYHIMTAEKDEQALAIIKNREVNMIIVSRPLDGSYFRHKDQNVFVHRLLAGADIDWLNRVEVPDNVPKDILIYKFDQTNDL